MSSSGNDDDVVAPLALIREMLPLFGECGNGASLNVGSVLGDIAYPLFTAYSASKFARARALDRMRRDSKPYGISVTYAAPRATRTDASLAIDPLVEPLQMRLDDRDRRGEPIWRAVMQISTVSPQGPERFFVLAQRLVPRIVDRAISTQMLDVRVRDYLKKSLETARSRNGAAVAAADKNGG